MFDSSNDWNMDFLQQMCNRQNHKECFTVYVINAINGNTRKIVQCKGINEKYAYTDEIIAAFAPMTSNTLKMK